MGRSVVATGAPSRERRLSRAGPAARGLAAEGLGGRGLRVLGARLRRTRRGHRRSRLDVVVLVVLAAIVARDRLLELAHAAPELAPEPGQALGSEDHQHDGQNDQELPGADAAVEHGHSLVRAGQTVGRLWILNNFASALKFGPS